ncbi:MAG: hypothetical protein K0M78_11540 [Brevundimonas sp.]|nr:hypothetical protein [Brevundimonas sp.]
MKWRRATKREALRSVPVYFTVAMLVGLLVNALFGDAPDYEGSFYRALCFAVVMPIASLLLKLRAEAAD